MTENDFHARRTELANKMAEAGGELLDFMGAAGALAAIPDSDRYVVAGDPAAIRAQLDTVNPQRRMRHGDRPDHDLYFGPDAGQPRRFAALITSSGHGVLQEYGSKFEYALPGQEVIDVVEMVPAIANKAEEEGELPALHAPECLGMNAGGGGHVYGYTYENVQEYARQAIAADRAARPVANKTEVDLDSIEQYRMQMAAISSAAIGYWVESTGIKPEYDTMPLRDVAKLYAKYETLHVAAQAGQVAVPGWISVDERLPEFRHECTSSGCEVSDSLMVYGESAFGAKGCGFGHARDDGSWATYEAEYDQLTVVKVTHWMPLPPSPASESLRSPQEAAGTEKGAQS